MLFESLRTYVFAIYRKSQNCAEEHFRLSVVWARSLLGKKEASITCLLLVGWFFPEFYGHQLYVLGALLFAHFVFFTPYALSLRLLVIYHVLSVCYFLAFRDFYKPQIELALDLAMLKVLFFEIILVVAVMQFHKVLMSVFGAMVVLGSIVTLCFSTGLTYVTTMNTAFLAVLLPFVPPIFLPLPLLAIYFEKGATSYGVVALHLLVLGVLFKSRWYLGLFVVGVVFGGLDLGQSIYDSGRATFFPITFHDWWAGNIFLGNGLGSFQILGPLLQKANHIDPGQYWLSLHNEWLQALHETGLIGVALLVWVFVDFLIRQRRQPLLFSTMLALGGAGVFYYPFKIPIFALVFAVLTAEGLRCHPFTRPKKTLEKAKLCELNT